MGGDDTSRAGISQSDKRKGSQRRSAMGGEQSTAFGAESDDDEIDVRKLKVNFDETK